MHDHLLTLSHMQTNLSLPRKYQSAYFSVQNTLQHLATPNSSLTPLHSSVLQAAQQEFSSQVSSQPSRLQSTNPEVYALSNQLLLDSLPYHQFNQRLTTYLLLPSQALLPVFQRHSLAYLDTNRRLLAAVLASTYRHTQLVRDTALLSNMLVLSLFLLL